MKHYSIFKKTALLVLILFFLLGNSYAQTVGGDFYVPDQENGSSNIELSATSVVAGSWMGVSFSVFNSSSVDLGISRINIIMSTDPDSPEGGQVISEFNVGGIGMYGSRNITKEILVPFGISTGLWYVYVVADADQEYLEWNETNNINIEGVPISVDGANYDLSISDINTNYSSVGSNTQVTTTVNNSGYSVAPDLIQVTYSLSTVPYFSSSAISLGTKLEYAAFQQSDTYDHTIFIPSNTAPGSYYLLGQVNSCESIHKESNTFNNTFSTPINIMPNLQLYDFVFESQTISFSTLLTGQEFTVANVLKNDDYSITPQAQQKYYLSGDRTFDGSDIYLGQLAIGAIHPKNNRSYSKTIHIPNVAPGVYFIVSVIDPDNSIFETNELNNTIISQVVVVRGVYDIAGISQIATPNTLHAGEKTTVINTVRNNSTLHSPETQQRIYLSYDQNIDPTDIALKEYNVISLEPYSDKAYSLQILIPELPAGVYYLISELDPDDEMDEAIKSNNSVITQITIEQSTDVFDLSFIDQRTDVTSGFSGEVVSIYSNVGNSGTAITPVMHQYYYISTDQIFDVSDIYLSSKKVGKINPGSNRSFFKDVTIPNISIGDYYIILVTDAKNIVSETDETNNIVAIPFSVTSAKKSLTIAQSDVEVPFDSEILVDTELKTGIDNFSIDFVAYPTLAVNNINVRFNSRNFEIGTINIYNINGQRVSNQTIEIVSGTNLYELNIRNLISGTYLINVETVTGNQVAKFIKQ